MKALRCLGVSVFGELREADDFQYAAGGELLVLPISVCSEPDCGEPCPCRRIFVGSKTKSPATMAMVSMEDDADLVEELAESVLARFYWRENRLGYSAAQLSRINDALEPFRAGQVVRVRTEEDRHVIYPAELIMDEDLALQLDYVVEE